MSVHCIAIGKADKTGVYLLVGDGYQAHQPKPVVDIDPCPCGRPDCDRDEWHELMNADPHGDLTEAQSLAIPY